VSSAQANKFYSEVAENGELWFGQLKGDILLEFDLSENEVSFPVWSSKSRLLRLKKLNPELLSEVEPVLVSWAEFKTLYVPLLEEKDRVIGVNLSGKNLSGFDMSINSLIKQVEAYL
jgi:hypothetical protein